MERMMSKLGNALGNAVREKRKVRQLSQEALAEKIGVCKRTIIDIENSTGNPKFELLCALVRELDLPVYEVFYPEKKENTGLRDAIMKELNGCSEYEMNVILMVVRSLKEGAGTEK